MLRLATPTIDDGPYAPHPAPEGIALNDGSKSLAITLASGHTMSLNANRLRAACRCALCRRARYDNTFPENFEDVSIERCEPLGHYGLNIVFSDGHARGIFPWSYLATLIEEGPAASS